MSYKILPIALMLTYLWSAPPSSAERGNLILGPEVRTSKCGRIITWDIRDERGKLKEKLTKYDAMRDDKGKSVCGVVDGIKNEKFDENGYLTEVIGSTGKVTYKRDGRGNLLMYLWWFDTNRDGKYEKLILKKYSVKQLSPEDEYTHNRILESELRGGMHDESSSDEYGDVEKAVNAEFDKNGNVVGGHASDSNCSNSSECINAVIGALNELGFSTPLDVRAEKPRTVQDYKK